MSQDRPPYKTLDGYIADSVYIDEHWQRLFELTRHPEMNEDERFCTIAGRTENIDYLCKFVSDSLETKTTDEWVRLLEDADIPVMRLNTPESLIEDPQMDDVGFWIEEEHPTEGLIRQKAVPHKWSGGDPGLRHPAPRLGENSTEFLEEFSISKDRIDALRQKRILLEPDQEG
nr:CoA transferase [Brevibacterium sp. VCM10]